MLRILVAGIMLLGLALAVSGLVLQRRALSTYGTEEGRRAVSLFHWKSSSRVTRWFTDDRGLDQYLGGQSLLSVGLTLVVAMVAFIVGRGW